MSLVYLIILIAEIILVLEISEYIGNTYIGFSQITGEAKLQIIDLIKTLTVLSTLTTIFLGYYYVYKPQFKNMHYLTVLFIGLNLTSFTLCYHSFVVPDWHMLIAIWPLPTIKVLDYSSIFHIFNLMLLGGYYAIDVLKNKKMLKQSITKEDI